MIGAFHERPHAPEQGLVLGTEQIGDAVEIPVHGG
jgi:hypothetical protein